MTYLRLFAFHERLDFVLVDLHVVAPGADHGEVGALDRVHAVVRATRDLELELVGQGGTVHVVDEVVHQHAVNLLLVGAGLFAARRADARHRRAHARTGAAEVEAVFVDFVEEVLGLLGGGADEHDVAGLAVERDQAGTVFLPGVGQLAQHLGGVVIAGRRLHAQRMEFLGLGEHRGDFGEARDDAAAVAEDRDRAALPVAKTRLIGVFELAQQVHHHVVVVRQALQAGHEARPRPALELVEHRRCVERLGGFLLFRDESRVFLGILGFVLSHVLSPKVSKDILRSARATWVVQTNRSAALQGEDSYILTGLAKFGLQAHHQAAFSAVSTLLSATDSNESRLECLQS